MKTSNFPILKNALGFIAAIPVMMLGDLLGTDYGTFGIAIILIAYIAGEGGSKYKQIVALVAGFTLLYFGSAWMLAGAGTAIVLLLLYSGERGANNRIIQYGFYAFYPAHLVIHPNMDTLLAHTTKSKAEGYLKYLGLTHGVNWTILQPMHFCHNFNVQAVWDNKS